ncbi:MAG: DUF4340 domain-containing protein, partial [Microcystaceae cyanobacterium]
VVGKPQREEIQAKQQRIFDFEEQDIKNLKIEVHGKTLEFERTQDVNQPWQMKQPENVPASNAAVSFLVNLLNIGKSDRTFKISSEQRQDYGLDQPLARVEIQLKNQEKHELILGKPDFENRFIYAQVAPQNQPARELSIILVPRDFQYAVERELKEWKSTSQF